MEERIKIPLRTAHEILWDVYNRGLGPRGVTREPWVRNISYFDRIPSLRTVRLFRAALEEGLPGILKQLPRDKPITFVGTGASSRRAFYILEATMKHIPEPFEDVKLAKIAHLSLPFSTHHIARDWRELDSFGILYSKSDYLPKYLPEITADLLGRKEHTVVRDSKGKEYYVVGDDLRNSMEKVRTILPDAREVITRRNPYFALYRDVLRSAAEDRTALVHLDSSLFTPPATVGGTAWYAENALRMLSKMHGLDFPGILHKAWVEIYKGTPLRRALDLANNGKYKPTEHEDLVITSAIYGPVDSSGPGGTIPTHMRRAHNLEAMRVVHRSGVMYLAHMLPVKRK
ncbi:MAG: hypothetical protein GXN93_03580 [Candidatus Diapherotrites archaeon]|nr:hypothetical protein [Candidatus Diapherotrites archaeon]